MRLALLFGLLLVAPLSHGGGQSLPEVLAVYHISTAEPYRQHIALLNIENHLSDLREQGVEASIRVLLEGDGVTLMVRAAQEPMLQQKIHRLRSRGVRFLVGENSLLQRGLAVERDLMAIGSGDLVENGILTLVDLQQQGYAYIPYPTE